MLDHKKTEMENKKETGRWAKEEHQRFMLGQYLCLFRHHAAWKGLEKSLRSCEDKNRFTGEVSCSKIL